MPDGEGDLKVAAEAGTAEEAVSLASRLIADVVVMDLGMPGGGLNIIRTVRASESPVLTVILFSDVALDQAIPAQRFYQGLT